MQEQHFWKSQFVALLLLAVLCLFLGLLLLAVHFHDGGLANWTQTKAGEVLAALLAALTARAVARAADGNGDKPKV